ncbi:MAG: flagellar biosynthetic protein FliO [Phycisphaeraceae bacterium]|nr:flagellar biosynthetic protein FliO [Phycisphaeraceae bacterium]
MLKRRTLLFSIAVITLAFATPVRGQSSLSDLAQQLAETRANTETEAPAPVETSAVEAQPLGSVVPDQSGPSDPADSGVFDTGNSWLLSTLTALGVVLGLVLLLRWLFVRYFGGRLAVRSTPVVEVLSRSLIAPRQHVLLLRVGSRILVVSESPGGMRTLADVDDPEEVASLIGAVSSARDNSISRGFSRMLHGFHGQYEDKQTELEGGDDGEVAVDRARDSLDGLLSRVRLMSGRQGDPS